MTDASQPDQDMLLRLIDAGVAITSRLDPEAVFQQLMVAASELTGARYAAIGVLDERRTGLDPDRFYALGIDDATRATIGDVPRGRGVLGTLISDPRPLRLADIGGHRQSYGFPLGHPPMRTLLAVPLTVRAEHWGNLYVAERASGEFDEADEWIVTRLASWAATAIENAESFDAEHRRRLALERTHRALHATTSIAILLAGETDLPRVLELIAKRARAQFEARTTSILLIDRDDIVVAASAGESAHSLLHRRYPLKGSAAELVLGRGRPIPIAQLPEPIRTRIQETAQTTTGVIAPLRFRGRALGAISAVDRLTEGPDFGPDDLPLIEAFAASAALAVGSAQTVSARSVHRALEAAELERTRWARALHEGAIQEFTALRSLLTRARDHAQPGELGELLDRANDRVATGIDAVYSLIADLRPPALDELGIQPALEALIRRIGALSGLEIELTVDLAYEQGRIPTRLSPAIEETIYRLIQETLTNAAKHAAASAAAVELIEADKIQITVRDDGRGFDPASENRGFGLLGLEERIELLGGTLELHTSPGSGTTVHAELPVTHGQQAPA